jgi:hypothetical protein
MGLAHATGLMDPGFSLRYGRDDASYECARLFRTQLTLTNPSADFMSLLDMAALLTLQTMAAG